MYQNKISRKINQDMLIQNDSNLSGKTDKFAARYISKFFFTDKYLEYSSTKYE